MSSSLAGPAHVLQLCCGTPARAALPAAERTRSIKFEASGLSVTGRLINDLFWNVIVCLASCVCHRLGARAAGPTGAPL